MLCDYKITLNYKGVPKEFIIPSVNTDELTSETDVLNFIHDTLEASIKGDIEIQPFASDIIAYMNEQDKPTISENNNNVQKFLQDKGININGLKNYVGLTPETNKYSGLIKQLIDPITESNAPAIEFVVRPDGVEDTLKGMHYMDHVTGQSKITLFVDSEIPSTFDVLSNNELSKTLAHELIHHRIDKTIGASNFVNGVFENEDIQMLNQLYEHFMSEIVKQKGYKDNKDVQEIIKSIQTNKGITNEAKRKQQLREFVSYVMTEPSIQEIMNKIKVGPVEKTETQSLLSVFVSWISNTFGIKIKGGYMLEDFLNTSTKLFNINKYQDQGFDIIHNALNNTLEPIKVDKPNKVIYGDIFKLGGIPVVTTNLGGVHGAGVASIASKKGLVRRGNGGFLANENLVQLPVKKVWDEKVEGKNLELMQTSLNKLVEVANENPNETYYLPLAGLGHGEGDPLVILPMLMSVLDNTENIMLVLADTTTNRGVKGKARTDNSAANEPEIKRILKENGYEVKTKQEGQIDMFDSSERRVADPEIYEPSKETEFITKDTIARIAVEVHEKYAALKEAKTLHLHYAEPISIDPSKKSSADLQMLSLTQNDLVRVKNTSWDKDLKKVVAAEGEYKDYTSYVSVLYSFYSEESNQVMVLVARKFGDLGVKFTTIPAEFVMSYRKFYGDVKENKKITSEEDIQRIVDKHNSLKYADNKEQETSVDPETEIVETIKDDVETELDNAVDLNENSALLKRFKKIVKKDGNLAEIFFYVANDKNAFAVPITKNSKAQLQELKENDMVHIRSIDYETKKQISYYAPVIRVFANAVEVARVNPNKEGKMVTAIIPFSRIDEAILLKENHGEIMEDAMDSFTEFNERFKRKMNDNPYIKKINIKKIDKFGKHVSKLEDADLKSRAFDLIGLIKPNEFKEYGKWKKDLGEDLATIDVDKLSNKELRFWAYQSRIQNRKFQIAKLKLGDWIEIEGKYTTGGATKTYKKWVQVLSVSSEKINYILHRNLTEDNVMEGTAIVGNTSYANEEAYRVGSVSIRTADSEFKKVALVNIAYNNKAEADIIDYYQNIKDTIEENFHLKGKIFDKMKTGENTSADWKNLFSSETNWSSLSERYHVEMFTDIAEDDEDSEKRTISEYKNKLTQVNRLKRGDVVYVRAPPKAKYKYSTKIVLDIDEDGLPIIGSKQKAGKRTNTVTKEEYNQGEKYNSYKLPFNKIIGVGFNTVEEPDIDITGNDYLLKTINSRKERYRKVFRPIVKTTIEDAEKFANAMKRKPTIVQRQKVTRTLKSGKTKDMFVQKVDEEKDIIIEGENDFIFKNEGIANGKPYSITMNNDSGYFKISAKDLAKLDPEKIFNEIVVGSVLKTTYVDKNGKTNYIDGMVTKKNKSSAKITTYYDDADGIEKSFTSDLFMKNDNGSKILKGLHSVMLAYDRSKKKDATYYGKLIGKPIIKKSKNTQSFIKSTDSTKHVSLLVNQLKNLYQIDMQMMTSDEIAELYDTPNMKFSGDRAFIIGDQIIINSDKASLAEPLHELSHLVLLGMRKSDNNLYLEAMNKTKLHPRYNDIAMHYPELQGSDLDEEVFATIFGENYRKVVKSEPQRAWEKENKSFFGRVVDNIKNFFKRLFNIDSADFDNLEPEDLTNLSIEDIMVKFGDDMLQGHLNKYLDDYVQPQTSEFNTLKQNLINSNLIEENCYG